MAPVVAEDVMAAAQVLRPPMGKVTLEEDRLQEPGHRRVVVVVQAGPVEMVARTEVLPTNMEGTEEWA